MHNTYKSRCIVNFYPSEVKMKIYSISHFLIKDTKEFRSLLSIAKFPDILEGEQIIFK